MSKYKDNFDKLAKSIYTKIIEEAAQQDPTLQAQAPQQQADPMAGGAAQTDPAAAGADPAAMAAPADPTMQADAGATPAPMDGTETGAEGQAAQAGEEAGTGETDEVGMSEIQEMAGELAQMLRDFKESNPDEFVEAAKFAAGMVISAAIKGLKYRDRKDILKKVKAGEFSEEGSEEEGSEEQPIEQQPEGQEEMVAERLRKDDSRCETDKRKGLNPKEKRNIKSKKSPFSGVNEEAPVVQTFKVNSNTPASEYTANLQAAKSNNAKMASFINIGDNSNGTNVENSENDITGLQKKVGDGNNVDVSLTAESVKLTKRQLEMIRLNETKTTFVKFSKKQLDEIMKK